MAGMADFLKGAQGIATNPLFMAGASIYRGGDPAQAMAQAQRSAAFADQQRQQQEQREQWQKMIAGGQLPASMKPYLPFLGPQQGAAMLAQHTLTAPDRARRAEMDAARLQLMKAQAAKASQPAGPRYINVGGTLLAIGADGKPTPLYTAPPKPPSALDQAKLSIFNQLQPQPQGPQPGQPQVLPQSYDGGAVVTDPNFIQAQTASPGPQQPQSPAGIFSGLTPEQRARVGLGAVMPGAAAALGQIQQENAWTKPTQNKIDEKIFNTTEQMARLQQIKSQFDPKYLTIGGGTQAAFYKWREKLRGGGELNPDEKKFLEGYSQFKQSALSNINMYIKEITGAQMSEKEADRIRQAMPDPGEGIFDGNSPSEFKAKLDNVSSQLTLAAARYNFLRSGKWQGGVFTGNMNNVPITLDQMRGIINNRGKEVLREMKMRFPNADPSIIQQQAKMKVKQEFGI